MQNRQSSAIATIAGLILQSPMFLLVSMMLSFIIMFGVQMFYYADMIFLDKVPSPFNWLIGAAIGLMTQLARLAFGIAGASDFAQGKTSKGLTGLIFSLGLAIVGAYEVAEISAMWANGDHGFYNSCMLVLQVIVWLGFILEIRMAITVGGSLRIPEQDQDQGQTGYVTSNGVGKRQRAY